MFNTIYISEFLSPGSISQKTHIKSLLLSHHHSTCALVSEILESVLQTVQKQFIFHIDYTYLQTYTDDNVQYTHTYTQYSVLLNILTVINTHYTPYVHILHMHTIICEGATHYT